MIRRPPRSTRTDTLFPYTTLFRSDPTQRAASQYIRAFRNPDLEQHIDQIGLSAFFDTSFAPHTDATKVAAEKPVSPDQWGQPGAMTAMLNWYRASAIDAPETGEPSDPPAFLARHLPPLTSTEERRVETEGVSTGKNRYD